MRESVGGRKRLPHLRRLAGMGPHEIYTRVRQEAGKRRDVLLHRLGIDPFRVWGSDPSARGRFYRDPNDTPRIVDLLGRRMPEVVCHHRAQTADCPRQAREADCRRLEPTAGCHHHWSER